MKTFGRHSPGFASIALVIALAGSGCSSDDEGEPPAMRGITEAHNRARAAVEPPAAEPLPPLSWSPELAEAAQDHADNCVFEHTRSRYGENLYAASGASAAPDDVVAAWVSEAEAYDLEDNTCSDVCGHYTQVVWADSLRLGCGVASCTDGSPFGGGSWQIWVCNYDPPGNFQGQRPY